MNEERLEHHLDRYLDDALLPDERAELEAELLASPRARAVFWQRARFHALLHRRSRENAGRLLAKNPVLVFPSPTGRKQSVRSKNFLHPLSKIALTIAAVLILWVGLSRVWDTGDLRVRGSGASAGQGIITIRHAADVEWTGTPRQSGDVLGPGLLGIQGGCVEIEFHSGARVVLEGPAELELITDMKARCRLGKLYAEVPPQAVGFEILSPEVSVVDRGTEFAMEVAHPGKTEIHVFTGKVDFTLTRAPGQPIALLEGKAILVNRNGDSETIPIRPASFASTPPAENNTPPTMSARFSAWEKASTLLRSDPSLIVQYTFDAASLASGTLRNHAPFAQPESHGTIIGCTLAEGRWPDKPALDFKHANDRVRFALARQHEQLTCVTWVRSDWLGKPYNALLMSSDAALGELQWQYDQDGRLIFGKRIVAGWGGSNVEQIETKWLLTPRRAGTWMQLAFVYDGRTGAVTHYLDGEQVGSGSISIDPPLTADVLEIGNWSPKNGPPPDNSRSYVGSMDELLIFSRALRDDEIQRLWNIGRGL